MHKCSNCSLNRKGLCESPNNKKCNSFLPAKENCRWCEYAETCQSLDRKTGILYVCTNFSKRETALPLHSFSDYDEYKRIHGIEDSNKKNKNKVSSKKKEIKKIKEDKEESDDYDFIIPTPKYDNPLPLKKKPIPKKSLYENDLLEEYPEKRNLWSPADIIDDIVSSEFDPRLFELVNDKDIPRPNNAIEFLTGPNFLSIDLFPRQWQIALEYFNAYCPYCSDTNFVRNKIVVDTPVEEIQDRVVLYNNAVCPKCGRNRYDAVNDGMHKPYEHFVGCVGQRAGKSKTAGMFSATILQQYLSLPNPVGFYRLGNDILKGTFVGIRFQDAVDNLWRPFESIVRASPWFKVYHDFLDAEGIRLGEELYKIRDSFIVYTYKSIACEAAGPDKRKLRGRTRFIASIDEIGWFSGKEGNLTLDADEVYTALDNSLLTVRSAFSKVFPANPHAPTAHGIWISSPSSKLDKIMRLYKQSVNSDNMYGIKCPTWEFNPNITKAALRNKYAENPVNAERDFGANPPFSDAPFIRSPADLIDLISKRSNVLHVERYRVTKDSLGVNLRYPAIATKPHEIPCCLAVDAGYNNNSFALSLCHWLMKEEETEDENGNTVLEKVRKPAVSGLLEIQPANGMPLSFPKIYENVILRIIEEFNVKLVAFDRWQSIDLRQRVFADTGVDAVQYSVNMADFDTVRGYIYSGDLILPKLDGSIEDIVSLEKDIATLTTGNPVTAFILQCLLSKDTGRIITKGEEISDDILRSSVLGLTLLDHPDFEDLFLTDATDLGNFTGLAGIGIGNTMGTLSASSGGVNSCSGLGCSLSIGR